MNGDTTIDIAGLQRVLVGLQNAFIGTGRDGDASTILVDEGRKWSAELSGDASPRSKTKAEKNVERDVKRFFRPGPQQIFPVEKRGGENGVTWLYAGVHFLVGVKNEDFQPTMTEGEMRKIMHTTPPRATNAYDDVGPVRDPFYNLGKSRRKNKNMQHAKIIDRILVRRERFFNLIKVGMGRVGRLKASLAVFAHKHGANLPGWVSKHIPEVLADGTGFTNESLNNIYDQSIEFGSRAPGVSKEWFLKEAHRATERRKYAIRGRITRVLSGYGDYVKGGREIKRLAKFNEDAFDAL